MKRVEIVPTFEGWRTAARQLLAEGTRADEVTWIETTSLAQSGNAPQPTEKADPVSRPPAGSAIIVPKAFVALAFRAARHSDPSRWALLYRLLWRVVHDDHELLHDGRDPDVEAALRLAARADEEVQPRSLLGEPLASASAFLPKERSVAALRLAASRCTACELYQHATQTVFSDGPATSRAMFIGEQPGDQEDVQGRPFVGPAGEVFTRALADAGIARESVYITNVVKHFKWEARGKRRIHLTPRQHEIEACRPWLEAEIDVLKPSAIVCLGSTAAQALMGTQFRIMRNRGQVFQTRWGPWLMATIHPSAILRIDDSGAQQKAYGELVDDLRKVAPHLQSAV